MFKGIYTATSGMLASSRQQEMLTNNLSNAQTPGYKQDQAVYRAFPDILMHRIEANANGSTHSPVKGKVPLGTLYSGVYTQEGIPNFIQGDIRETGRMVDFALVDQSLPPNPETNQKGNLFFAVQMGEDEIRYTRNGQFTVSTDGFLTTADGHYVLNDLNDQIRVSAEGFRVAENGNIYQMEDGEEVWEGYIHLAYIEQPQDMVKEGNGLWRYDGEQDDIQDIRDTELLLDLDPEQQGYPFQVMQGHIEGSNVDVTHTMTDMLTTYRLYEANQKVLQAYDQSLDKTVNEIGRV